MQRTRQPRPLSSTEIEAVEDKSHETTPTPTQTQGEDSGLEWALVRFVVSGSATSPKSPISEGYIPARLIGAPVYQTRAGSQQPTTAATNGGRRSVRRWLAPSGFKSRSAGPSQAVKRGSRADLPAHEVLPSFIHAKRNIFVYMRLDMCSYVTIYAVGSKALTIPGPLNFLL